MTQHVTIASDEQELGRARELAERLGVPVEEYLRRLISGHMPGPERVAGAESPVTTAAAGQTRHTGTITDIFDLVRDGEPTDIARDKDKLIGEAIIKHHQEETGQA